MPNDPSMPDQNLRATQVVPLGTCTRANGVLMLSACCRDGVVFDDTGRSHTPIAIKDLPMTVDPEEILDAPRLITPAELAEFVKMRRSEHKWSQPTLAELAGVDARTIQRVENGEPSSFDTRRAIARAFQCDDLDVFNKPMRLPNVEKLKAYCAELDKTTVIIPITRIRDARTLRTMTEGASAFDSEELGELSAEARKAFASIVDYLHDYNDVRDEYSMSQRLDVDRDIDALLKEIVDSGTAIGAGLRHTKVRAKSEAPNLEPMDWTIIYFVLAPNDALPANVRVAKRFKI
jgi:transcriptional regulator with XRE-family HTH domain